MARPTADTPPPPSPSTQPPYPTSTHPTIAFHQHLHSHPKHNLLTSHTTLPVLASAKSAPAAPHDYICHRPEATDGMFTRTLGPSPTRQSQVGAQFERTKDDPSPMAGFTARTEPIVIRNEAGTASRIATQL